MERKSILIIAFVLCAIVYSGMVFTSQNSLSFRGQAGIFCNSDKYCASEFGSGYYCDNGVCKYGDPPPPPPPSDDQCYYNNDCVVQDEICYQQSCRNKFTDTSCSSDYKCINQYGAGASKCAWTGKCYLLGVTTSCGNNRVDYGEECDGDLPFCGLDSYCFNCKCYEELVYPLPTPSASWIVDDFAPVGFRLHSSPQYINEVFGKGYNSSYTLGTCENGNNINATWAFAVTPGIYEIWIAKNWDVPAFNQMREPIGLYTVYDGAGDGSIQSIYPSPLPVSSTLMMAEAADGNGYGVKWKKFGEYFITSDRLYVVARCTDELGINNPMYFDAVRIEKLEPITAVDDTEENSIVDPGYYSQGDISLVPLPAPWIQPDHVYNGDHHKAQCNLSGYGSQSGSEEEIVSNTMADWHFEVTPGEPYLVAVNYLKDIENYVRIPYTIYDGATPLGTVNLNQHSAGANTSPNDEYISADTSGYHYFEQLGEFTPQGSVLTVRAHCPVITPPLNPRWNFDIDAATITPAITGNDLYVTQELADSNPVVPGGQLKIKVRIRNGGTWRAKGVQLINPIPISVYNNVYTDNGQNPTPCSRVGNDIVCAPVEIASNSEVEYILTFNLRENHQCNSIIINQPEARLPSGRAFQSAPLTKKVNCFAPAQLVVTAERIGTGDVMPGDRIEYDVTVTNVGQEVANAVRAVVAFSTDNLWFQSVQSSAACRVRYEMDEVDCTPSTSVNLDENESSTYRLVFDALDHVTCPQTLSVLPTGISSNTDDVEGTAVEIDLKCPIVNSLLVTTVRSGDDQLEPGDNVTYDVRITNTGDEDANNVTLFGEFSNSYLELNTELSDSDCRRNNAFNVRCPPVVLTIRPDRYKDYRIVLTVPTSLENSCPSTFTFQGRAYSSSTEMAYGQEFTEEIICSELPVCGNGIQEGNEVCDNGPNNSDTIVGSCRTDCTGTVQTERTSLIMQQRSLSSSIQMQRGSLAPYYYRFTNVGSVRANNVYLTTNIPSQLELVQGSGTHSSCSQVGNQAVCGPYSLRSITRKMIWLTFMVKDNATCASSFSHKMTLMSDNSDPVEGLTERGIVNCQ